MFVFGMFLPLNLNTGESDVWGIHVKIMKLYYKDLKSGS